MDIQKLNAIVSALQTDMEKLKKIVNDLERDNADLRSKIEGLPEALEGSCYTCMAHPGVRHTCCGLARPHGAT
jgi:cell division protein FtsB